MFRCLEDSGEKLMVVTKVLFVLTIIGAVCLGFILGLPDGVFTGILLGFVFIIPGYIGAWLTALPLAAIAEAAMNSHNVCIVEQKSAATPVAAPTCTGSSTPSGIVTCPACGKTQYPGNGKCFSCGADL